MNEAFKPGTAVRSPITVSFAPPHEVGNIVRYDGENFYIVQVTRGGRAVDLVCHEDNLELAGEKP